MTLVRFSSSPEAPAFDAVLMTEHVEGCRSIIGYIDGKMAQAVYCCLPTVTQLNRYGKQVMSSWCEEHKALYFRATPALNVKKIMHYERSKLKPKDL
jgi:hypothetical protein